MGTCHGIECLQQLNDSGADHVDRVFVVLRFKKEHVSSLEILCNVRSDTANAVKDGVSAVDDQ